MAKYINIVEISELAKTRSIIASYIDGIGKEDAKENKAKKTKKEKAIKAKEDALMKSSGFKLIKAKAKRNGYATFDEFAKAMGDFATKAKRGTEKAAAEWLKDTWEVEMDETIAKCIDCYYFWAKYQTNNPYYFTWPCTEPHLLVYVQEPEDEGSQWWPAKVLSDDGNNTVTIECFGDHMRGPYPYDQCILFSDSQETLEKKKENASKLKRVDTKTYVRSFKEAMQYIENIKEKYSESAHDAFVPANRGRITNVNRNKRAMFPAAFADDVERPRSANAHRRASVHVSCLTPAVTPSSQGYSSYESDDSIDSSVNLSSLVGKRMQAVRRSTLSRKSHVKTEDSGHEDDPHIESRDIDSDSMPNETPSINKKSRTRQNDHSVTSKDLPASLRKNTARSSRRIAEMNDDVTGTDDESDEGPSTSRQSPKRQKRNTDLWEEFGKVGFALEAEEATLEALQAKKGAITRKLNILASPSPKIKANLWAELGKADYEVNKQKEKVEELRAKYNAIRTKLN